MYNGSDCDRKCQLSLILTEPLNPREGTVNVFFLNQLLVISTLLNMKKKKRKFSLFTTEHPLSKIENFWRIPLSFFTVEDHWLISDLELKYNYVDRPIKLAGYIYYWCSTM